MTVHQDYEIKINLNELIEKRIPCCDLLHPDHCLTEKQVSEIAHAVSYTHLTLPTKQMV